jgi:integrase
VTFRAYSADYLPWAQAHKRGWKSDRTIISAVLPVLGDRRLDEITTADVERFRDSLVPRRSRATANRYRDGLSGMFRRAIRLGLLDVNPVKGVPKFREGKGRVLYFTAEEEAAIRDALPIELRRHFAVSIHTGLRYSEQMGLRWRDVDLLADIITVPRSKNGDARQVPINSLVRSVAFDLGSRRQRPDDPEEHVFALRPGDSSKFFPAALERAQAALRDAGKDASRLEGAVWHTCRHTFASRLVMAGVDLRTVQELGGWRPFAMVQRYSHLAPAHLRAAVERLVPAGQAGSGKRRSAHGTTRKLRVGPGARQSDCSRRAVTV